MSQPARKEPGLELKNSQPKEPGCPSAEQGAPFQPEVIPSSAGLDDLDKFVLAHPEPYLEQLSVWGEVKKLEGWTSHRTILRKEGKVVGGAQLLEQTLKKVVRIGYLSRGPLVATPSLMPEMVNQVVELSEQRRQAYLAVSLPYGSHETSAILRNAHFSERPPNMPPAVWVRATLTLDLTKDEPALLKDMNHTVRWSIRKSAERGIQMRAGGEDDLGVFHDQVLALCRRRGVRSNMPGKAGLHLLWKQLAPAGQMKLFLAEFEGRPVSSMMVIALGKWARAWRVGWSGEHPKLFPSHACYWAAIQWAKQSGCSHFDFLGVDERDARELLEGRGADHPYHCSITQFKVSFGGTLHVLPGEFCYFPNRALRWAFGFAGDRLLRSPWFLKTASRIAKSRQA